MSGRRTHPVCECGRGKEEDGTGGVHHEDGWRFVVGGGVMGEMFNLDQIATLRAAPMACFLCLFPVIST